MRRMSSVLRSILVLIFLMPLLARAEDYPGSADHVLVGRFDGSEITFSEEEAFDEYEIWTDKPPAAPKTVEGVTTRISYKMPPNVSLAAVARNFRTGLEAKGFTIDWSCETDECGGGDLIYATELFGVPYMAANPFSYHYMTGHQTVDGREVFATVVISDGDPILTQVTVVESAEMADSMIDAQGIRKGVLEDGRVALYGIQFDTDKADIKPESAPTLVEIAGFMQAAPDLSVVIVGHTDNQGEMDYNLDLSHRRATAVRQALIDDYGIAGDRMVAAGAGFLAPLAVNTTEAGRALNRRVEIIAR